jgi:ubiquitin C-terminal hydrolase
VNKLGVALRRKFPELSLPPKGQANPPKVASDLYKSTPALQEHCFNKLSDEYEEMETSPPAGSPRKISKVGDGLMKEVHPSHKKSSQEVCGLAKLDNNGFVNSIVQCLYRTKSLRYHFIGENMK